MRTKVTTSPNQRLERELARERAERLMNDEAKTSLCPTDGDYRSKDARESASATRLKRSLIR